MNSKAKEVKFPKTVISIPAYLATLTDSNNPITKEQKQIHKFQSDLNHLLDKNEEAIRGYVSRYIYTSSISTETNQQLDIIFKSIRASLTSE